MELQDKMASANASEIAFGNPLKVSFQEKDCFPQRNWALRLKGNPFCPKEITF